MANWSPDLDEQISVMTKNNTKLVFSQNDIYSNSTSMQNVDEISEFAIRSQKARGGLHKDNYKTDLAALMESSGWSEA